MRVVTHCLAAFAMAAVSTLACSAGGVSNPTLTPSVHSKPVVDVQMDCNTMVGAFEVSALAARSMLPSKYELALQPDGNALVYLQVSNCSATGNGEELTPLDLVDAWLVIQGPFDYRPIPGAYITLPTTYVYVLEAQTTSKWLKTHGAAIHFPKKLIRSIDVGGPIVPLRSGSAREMTGAGYRWSEFLPCIATPGSPYGECWMFPGPGNAIPVGFAMPPFPIGYNIRGFIERADNNGAKKEMGCLMNVAGQGLIRLELDPASDLAKLGIFQSPQVGYFFDSMASCHLVMTQN